MSLGQFRDRLAALPAQTAITFQTPDGATCDSYHLTEVKRARIDSLDCAGTPDSWVEAQAQILDSPGSMTAGKLAGVLDKVLTALPELHSAPLSIEFAHGNDGLGLYEIAGSTQQDGTLTTRLRHKGAMCKPAARIQGCAPAAPAKRSSPAGCCA